MPREHENFRANLERLDAMLPGKELLTPTMVGQALGICRQTAAKRYAFRDGYINKVELARQMSRTGA
jgi:hypothetical protein